MLSRKVDMNKIKEYMMITIAALAFMLITGIAKADEKTYTPQETVKAFSEVPGKVAKHISNEWSETKEFQTKSWTEFKFKVMGLTDKFLSN